MTFVTHADRVARLQSATLYFVTDTEPGGRDLATVLPAVLAAGVDIVQLRDKHADDDALRGAAAVIRQACDDAGALFIINDRADLVGPMRADGAHLGQTDGPLDDARAVAGRDALIGRSTHAVDDLLAAIHDGADYAGVGPVFATPTKAGRAPVGLEYVRVAAAHTSIPWFAIGGIDETNVGNVRATGASRIAVVRAIAEAADPARATAVLAEPLRP